MNDITYEKLRAVARRKGYTWFTKPYDLNVWGVRRDEYVADAIDDMICAAYVDQFGHDHVLTITATTDPGLHYMKNLLNPKGCAFLKPGQYLGSHRLGRHRGQYKALVQVKPMDFWRVKVGKDGKPDWKNATSERSIIGANIHRMMELLVALSVGKFSAGCQVAAIPWEFACLLHLVDMQVAMLKTDVVSYTLIMESDLS